MNSFRDIFILIKEYILLFPRTQSEIRYRVLRNRSKHFIYTDRMVRMPSSNVSVNVRRRIILFVAVGTRVSRLAAFVSKQVPHPSEARVAFRADVAVHRSWVGPLRQLCIWKQAKTLVSQNNHFQLQSFLKLNDIVTQPSDMTPI